MTSPKLRVIPLGGLGEIGKNMMVFESDEDIVVIDAGIMFPPEDLLGVDLIIPDISYLLERKEKIRGILITHGHEDHTGALPYVLSQLQVPVYAPRLAHGLISVKLQEQRSSRGSTVVAVEPGIPVALGSFEAEFFRVCHSIPDAMGIALRTPLGLVLHTGDFKIDHTPVDGMPTDFTKLAELTSEGVLLLCSDSTYSELPGYTPSERIVGDTLNRVLAEAPGRVIIATFASLISRIQQVINAAAIDQRRMGVVGRSMINNVKMALEMGYLQDHQQVLAPLHELKALPKHKVVIATTGSQGEPTSALVRMANKEMRDIQILPGDTVVISASPIPGNQLYIGRTVDNLTRQGARVLYERNALVHVHGHASQEELKLMLNIARPKYFVPIHGEYRHLVAHAGLAMAVGVDPENAFVLEDGDVLELTSETAAISEQVSAGDVYVQGRRVWQAGSLVLKDRKLLSREGVVIVVVTIDSNSGNVTGNPRIITRGLAGVIDSDELVEKAESELRSTVMTDDTKIGVEARIQETMGKFLHKETGRKPIIITVPVNV